MTQKKIVRIISKPPIAPFDDASKNIVKEHLLKAQKYKYQVITDGQNPYDPNFVKASALYKDYKIKKLNFINKLALGVHGFFPGQASLYHYYFTPNATTSAIGKIQQKITKIKTIQTICSEPASYEKINQLLFTDKVIALSKHTKKQLINAGVKPFRIAQIYPGITPPEKINSLQKKEFWANYNIKKGKVALFCGDLDFSDSAHTMSKAARIICQNIKDIHIIFAFRDKTNQTQLLKQKLYSQLEPLKNRICFAGYIQNLPQFIQAVDMVVLPAQNLKAKMDIPLVLLEAMSSQIPVIVSNYPPLLELAQTGGALSVQNKPESIAEAMGQIAQNEQLSKQIGAAGKEATQTIFSSSSMAAQIEALYEETLFTEA